MILAYLNDCRQVIPYKIIIFVYMLLQSYANGILTGILASVPLGPIGVLIIQRTLSKGRYAGLFSGIGAAFSDMVYAIIAAFSLSFVIDFVREQQNYLQLFGSIVVLGFGVFLFLSNPVGQLRRQQKTSASTLFNDLATTFAITISNPMIIFIFLGIFTGFNIIETGETEHILITILGIFSGAILWWFFISTLVSLFRGKFNPRRLFWVNRISGIVIMTLAGLSVVYALAKIAGMNLPAVMG